MSPRKILLLLAKAVGIYLIVFVIWIFISPVYLHLIAFVSAKLIPAVLIEDYRLQSYFVNPDQNPENAKRNQIRYYIQVTPRVRNWIQFGATDLAYPLVTFFTLMLVTPNLGWKRRLKFLAIGFVILWLFYSLLAVFFFRVTCFQQGRELAHLGMVEEIFGIERLARWKSGGGITILAGQFVPVAIWFVAVFKYLFRRQGNKLPAQG